MRIGKSRRRDLRPPQDIIFSHFTDEGTEAKRARVSCRTWLVAALRFKLVTKQVQANCLLYHEAPLRGGWPWGRVWLVASMNCGYSMGGGQGHNEEGRGQAWEEVQEVQFCSSHPSKANEDLAASEGTDGETLRPSPWILQLKLSLLKAPWPFQTPLTAHF